MTHEDAIREMAVERYLLDELTGESRDNFEEHIFECEICAADLKAGATFMDAGRSVAKEEAVGGPASRASIHALPRGGFVKRVRPWVLIPALAASLLVLIYQNTLVLPRMRREVARAEAPEILNSLVLTNINARGDALPEIVVPAAGSFLIAVDIPLREGFPSYVCSLYGPSGTLLWKVPLSAQQAENTVSLRVPTDKVEADVNVLLVQGIPASGTKTPVDIGSYRFRVRARN